MSVSHLLHLVVQNDKIGIRNQITLFDAIIDSPKFRNLFVHSLEMDKFTFIERLALILDMADAAPDSKRGPNQGFPVQAYR